MCNRSIVAPKCLTCVSCVAGPEFAYPPPQIDGCPPACPVAELAGPPDDLAFPAPDAEIGTSRCTEQHNNLAALNDAMPALINLEKSLLLIGQQKYSETAIKD